MFLEWMKKDIIDLLGANTKNFFFVVFFVVVFDLPACKAKEVNLYPLWASLFFSLSPWLSKVKGFYFAF